MAVVAILFCVLSLSFVKSASSVCSWTEAKQVQLYTYWIPGENSLDMNENGTEISLSGPQDTELNLCDSSKGPLISKALYDACVWAGICRMFDDSKLYTLDNEKHCFTQLNNTLYPWGHGPLNAFEVFASIGANDVPLGTTLEIEELKGVVMPGKWKVPHNGCVRVDDVCENCDPGCDQIVLQTGSYSLMKLVNWPTKVTLKESKCNILRYVTMTL